MFPFVVWWGLSGSVGIEGASSWEAQEEAYESGTRQLCAQWEPPALCAMAAAGRAVRRLPLVRPWAAAWADRASSHTAALWPWTDCETREAAFAEAVVPYVAAVDAAEEACGPFAVEAGGTRATPRGTLLASADAPCLTALDQAEALGDALFPWQRRLTGQCVDR